MNIDSLHLDEKFNENYIIFKERSQHFLLFIQKELSIQSTIINIRFDLNGSKIVPIKIALYPYLSTHSTFHFVLNA